MNSSLFARLAVALPRPFTKSSLWAARGWGSKLAGDVRGWFRGDRWVSIRQAAGTGAWSWQQLRRSACPPQPPPPTYVRRNSARAPGKSGVPGARSCTPGMCIKRRRAGGGCGGRSGGARACETLPRSSLLTWSYELSQHGVSHCTASAGLPGTAGPGNRKHIGYQKEKKGGGRLKAIPSAGRKPSFKLSGE